jgi:hypothetical protein
MYYTTMTQKSWKTVVSLFVVCSISFGAAAGEEGLVALYRFEEGVGRIAYDSSTFKNDGSITGATWVTGPYGTALSFDGADDFVDCGSDESLRIEAAGSVAFWFKPAVCQGGLVNWSFGSGWLDERLVISFNTYGGEELLGVYMSNAKTYSKIYTTGFPPVDAWTHFAMTFDGLSMTIYRDGAYVDSVSTETMRPNLENVPMWIGKSLGLGESYFNGLIDEVHVYNCEISARRILELYKADAEQRGKDTTYFNKVSVEAVTYPIQGRIVAELDFREMWPTPEGLTMEAELRDEVNAVVCKGAVCLLPVWGLAESRFDTSSLVPGEYVVSVVARKPSGEIFGKESRTGVTWTDRPEVFTRIKVLNNLCWELLNVTPEGSQSKEYSFPNPRSGWVYFSTEAEGSPTLSVPGAEIPVIHDPANGARQQAMRFLPEGEHTVEITGAGALKKLVVRSVPKLVFSKIGQISKITPYGTYDWAFLERDILPNTNSQILGAPSQQQKQLWVDMGGRWVFEDSVFHLQTQGTKTIDVYHYITGLPGMTQPLNHGVILDEFGQCNEDYYLAWIEASNMILADPKYTNRMIIPYCATVMYEYERSKEFIRTLIEYGSHFARERYLWEQPSENKAVLSIQKNLADEMPHWEAAIPGATSHMVVALGYMSQPPESLNVHPTVNFKVFMDMEFQHLATHPDFFGVAGILEYNAAYCDEENIRWQGRLYRHYALEGNTDRLSADPYVLPHIQNPDFDKGTENWTIQMAALDSVQIKSYEGYSQIQGRYRPTQQGDTFLRTTRSPKHPNTFSQEIKALKPGQLYSMKMITADYQDIIGGVSDEKLLTLSVQINNAEMHTAPDKNFQFVSKSTAMLGNFNPGNPAYINYHWYVFRALGQTAELLVSDWESDANPGGPIGQEIMYNFIEIQPYLEAKTLELSVLTPNGGGTSTPAAPNLSLSTGGVLDFNLFAGSDYAGRDYFLLGSMSGTSPGFPLPNGLIMPLNRDIFTSIVSRFANSPVFLNFNATLDSSGRGWAQMDSFGPLPPGFLGVTLNFAYLLFNPIDFTSNAVGVDIVP